MFYLVRIKSKLKHFVAEEIPSHMIAEYFVDSDGHDITLELPSDEAFSALLQRAKDYVHW